MIAALQRIASAAPDACVSQSLFKDETGWDRYWFDKHWPIGGYQSACVEAGVQRGAIFGVETLTRVTDAELAVKFGEAVEAIGQIPSLKRFIALARIGSATILRGDSYSDAKRRIISAYFESTAEERKGEVVERILRDELRRLTPATDLATSDPTAPVAGGQHSIRVPSDYIALVREFRDRGEEEKRQLVAQFFYSILRYKRARVRSEHDHNDVRVNDRCGQPWLVVEVKPLLEAERERRAARRQSFDYAHRHGMRFVVISDDDFYEVYDRSAMGRLRYDEMRQGSFQLTALRDRDSDLLQLLASER